MSIYESAVKKPITTLLIFVAIIILGLYSLTRLPIDLLPEIENKQLLVITSYSGASASDIETNISKPLENTLNTLGGLKHITSQSKENVSIVSLNFNYGTNIDVATNDVRDKLDVIRKRLPEDADDPIILKFGADDIPILILSVTAKQNKNALNKILENKVTNPMARIQGVGAVSIVGAPKREVHIYCDPFKLEALNLTVEQIASKIRQENKNIPIGILDIGSNTFSIRSHGEFDDARQLENLIVGSLNGKYIYLKDVARVEDSIEERMQEAYTNGKQGAIIIINKQSGANSVAISNEIKALLPKLEKDLPSDMKINELINTSTNIQNTIISLTDTIMITFVIVMLVVLIFLGRWRATFIIILTIPISLIASFIYLLVSGNSLNIISLSSLSIAIGMVVDDAIVVLENVTTHIERGSGPKQAAIHGTNEVAVSVIASTLTMLAVFLPLTMISGMAGILFKQLGWIVSIIMIVSTTGALTLTPMLSSKLLKKENKKSKLQEKLFGPADRLFLWFDTLYGRFIHWSIRHRTIITISALVIFTLSMGLKSFIKSEFFPTQDNGIISAQIELPIGTRLEISRDLGKQLSQYLLENYKGEIDYVNFMVGQAGADNAFANLNANGSNIILYNIRLTNLKQRKRSMMLIADEIRDHLKEIPEIHKFEVNAGGNNGGGAGGQSMVNVDIFGYDFESTDKIASKLADRMKQIKGCAEVTLSREEYSPEYQVSFDREKLSMNGLSVLAASSALRNRINGSVGSYFREEGDEYAIRVSYAPEYKNSINSIENILIYNPMGQAIRLKDVGSITEMFTPPTIERKDRSRVISVKGIVGKGGALSDVVSEVQTILNEIDIPSNISYEIGGSYEDQQEVFGDLILLMALVVILVYIVMAAQFESFTDPFVIMFSIPFAFTGVFLGLFITGTTLNVMSMIGILMLLGIVVKNGIVLIDYTRLCRERGMGILQAVESACRSRLRPVLMTTMTTVLGMLPMALGKGEGAEMWRPMGASVAWGLTVSTLITLVIVPVVYSIFAANGVKRRRKRLRKKQIKMKATL